MRSLNSTWGHAAAFSSYLIFGFNIIACKSISNAEVISPLGLFCFRSIGATLLFWIVSFFLPKEKVDKTDLVRIFFASMLGLYLTQISFLKSITLITPFDTSIVASLTPIMTMFTAAIYLKEPITIKKFLGVFISFTGVVFLILNSFHATGTVDKSSPLGIFLMILNCLFFALYLGMFRPVIVKYNVVTFMKWMFLFSFLASVPFDIKELTTLDYLNFPTDIWLNLLFVIIFSTFIAYFLISTAQKFIRPTLVSMYSYLQPIVATCLSIYLGMDALTWQKCLAAFLVFTGVVIVNNSKAKEDIKKI